MLLRDNNRRNKQFDTKIIDENLNLDLLYSMLDEIGESFDDPSYHVIEKGNLSCDPKLVGKIRELNGLTFWTQLDDNLSNRPKICIKCIETDCVHIYDEKEMAELQNALSLETVNCSHLDDEDWVIDNTCIKCIMDICEIMEFSEKSDILYLWDTFDLAEYTSWLSQLGPNWGLTN